MAQDHFVARTYLKHFGDPAKGGMLQAYRKTDGTQFPCWPKDVCREWDGDLNHTWLTEPALLGHFRKIFEPLWNVAMETLLSKSPSHQDKFAVSGLVANLMTCTPAWRRIGVQMYNDQATAFLLFSKKIQEKYGGNPGLPIDAIEMVEQGQIKLDHDPNFIKGEYTRQLMQHAWFIFHQDWEIIENPTAYAFLTSDNPVSLLPSSDFRRPPTRFLPITPKLCLSFRATRTQLPAFDPALPSDGAIRWSVATSSRAKSINKLIAQCADDLVLSPIKSTGIASLVANCARFRVEPEYVEFPAAEPDAIYQGTIVRVREARRA